MWLKTRLRILVWGQLASYLAALELAQIIVEPLAGAEAQDLKKEDSSGSEEDSSDEDSLISTVSEMEAATMTKRNWVNILLLGGGFLLLFTAFQTSAFVQVTLVYKQSRSVNWGVNRGGVHLIGEVSCPAAFSAPQGYKNMVTTCLRVEPPQM